jgi:hypothetical protein
VLMLRGGSCPCSNICYRNSLCLIPNLAVFVIFSASIVCYISSSDGSKRHCGFRLMYNIARIGFAECRDTLPRPSSHFSTMIQVDSLIACQNLHDSSVLPSIPAQHLSCSNLVTVEPRSPSRIQDRAASPLSAPPWSAAYPLPELLPTP